MKTKLLQMVALLALGCSQVFGHTNAEIGPGGGRILDFSKDESLHGEVTLKDGKFHVALLDKDLKPVPISNQALTATSGNRQKPEKLAVEKQGSHFVVQAVPAGEWVIFQLRVTPKAKPITARLEYNTHPCPACKSAEWLCKCAPAEEK